MGQECLSGILPHDLTRFWHLVQCANCTFKLQVSGDGFEAAPVDPTYGLLDRRRDPQNGGPEWGGMKSG